jgi:hypothetical protein
VQIAAHEQRGSGREHGVSRQVAIKEEGGATVEGVEIGAQQSEFAPQALGLATAVVIEDRLCNAPSHRHYSKDRLWMCREGWMPFMSPA